MRRQQKKRRFFGASIIILPLLVIFAGRASAHGNLVRSSPEANAVLEVAPAQVEIYFSEALEQSFSTIQVLDSTGKQFDGGDSKVDPVDPTRLTVSLRTLPPGIYTVVWRALSAVDGHITSGAFPFAVGNVDEAALAAAAAASQRTKLPFGEVAARWMQYLSVASLAGGMLFILAAWQPAYRKMQVEQDFAVPEWRSLEIISLIVLVLANILFLLVQAGQVRGLEFAPPWSENTGTLLFTTRFGTLWLSRILLAFALVAVLLRTKISLHRWVAFILAISLALVISIGSHAAAEPQPVLPIFMDWLHMLGSSIWVGGLIYFVIGLRRARKQNPPDNTKFTSILIPRFSVLAAASVVALAISGLYSLVLQVGTLDALLNSLYGQTMIFKWAIAGAMLFLGAINLLVVSPRMRKAAKDPSGNVPLVARFSRLITGEVALGALLLLVVGVLTALPPAQDAAAEAVTTAKEVVDDLEIKLDITPGSVGMNTYTVTVTNDSQPVVGANEVALRFTATSGDLPPSEAILEEGEAGTYSIRGPYFGLADNWQVQAVVRREGFFDAYANFYFPIGVAVTENFPWYKPSSVILLVAALALFFAMQTIGKQNRRSLVLNAGLSLGMVMTGINVFINPPGIDEEVLLVNPIPPNAESIAAGKKLFQENCVPCHGVSGRGDGPLGIGIYPRPGNLTVHTEPGVHPDGRLFKWISEGYPNSQMPDFETNLTEEQRWHLVNYIRTLYIPNQ